ncbi:hypothetical protein TW82_17645 [Pseudoalteromonas fuliginea]|uniref:Uncharacterized protein n=1 Tax=Pseudoalteromonas fuliginea TaxID=1872678 RepID=A0ABD3Y5M2_9GAMM|nr:hypothetical protein D172_013190 [Pseudoalteromonas sp. Bsw20308]KDC49210.1 hypothetical protein DC53_17565 [Pseudoalteromonas fuliginea]KDC53399.1 hypothetical protein DO88_13365 [Pseudoalteromonas sp. S3431]KJZ25492.1 hypothetical protein TW82_17645 [Pseudoalteromonas fuliginea]
MQVVSVRYFRLLTSLNTIVLFKLKNLECQLIICMRYWFLIFSAHISTSIAKAIENKLKIFGE